MKRSQPYLGNIDRNDAECFLQAMYASSCTITFLSDLFENQGYLIFLCYKDHFVNMLASDKGIVDMSHDVNKKQFVPTI